MEKLKAQAYDALIQVQNWQAKLQEINKQIAEFKEPEVIEPEVVK
jgi:hypothetical protein